MDRNKEYQKHLKQYISSNIDSSTDPNILQMQNFLLSNTNDEAPKIKKKFSTETRSKTTAPKSQQQTLQAPILINHGDINININISEN